LLDKLYFSSILEEENKLCKKKTLPKLENTYLSIFVNFRKNYTLSEAWSNVNWADLMAAQGAFGTDFYDRSNRTIAGTMLWTEYRPVIKIGSKGALDSHEINPIHSAPSLGQSIVGIMQVL